MKHTPDHWNQILDHSISGFHQYCFEDQPRLCYVSGNLLCMLGYSRQEPEADSDAFYINRIHPADRRNYDRFLQTAAEGEGQYTAQYRLLKKDGTVLHVQDTLTVYDQDGVLLGDSVLADITALKQENRNLQFLNETIPCGFLKYTCETAPKLTFINDQICSVRSGSRQFVAALIFRMSGMSFHPDKGHLVRCFCFQQTFP